MKKWTRQARLAMMCLVLLLVMDNALPQSIDLTNCFLRQDGHTVCYDKNTGRQIIFRRV